MLTVTVCDSQQLCMQLPHTPTQQATQGSQVSRASHGPSALEATAAQRGPS